MKDIKLSVLELGSSFNTNEIYRNVISYAVEADSLGFHRFWIGEHYLGNSGWYTPETLVPIIAGCTKTIRIGVGGILLALHNPYLTALNFKLLNSLFVGRIDLGLANGSSPEVILNYLNCQMPNSTSDVFKKNQKLLLNILSGKKLVNGRILTPPIDGIIPDIWNLGFTLSDDLTKTQIRRMNFCKSLFHSPNQTIQNLKIEIDRFREKIYMKVNRCPNITIAIAGICDKSTQKAKKLRRQIGRSQTVMSFNEIIGCPNEFYDRIHEFSDYLDISEFMYLNKAIDLEDKKRSLELLSEKFALN